MRFRIFQDETVFVIEAPGDSRVTPDGEGQGELVLFEAMPGGSLIERRLPTSVVIRAARQGYLGLRVREVRRPWGHPEAIPDRPADERRVGVLGLPRLGS